MPGKTTTPGPSSAVSLVEDVFSNSPANGGDTSVNSSFDATDLKDQIADLHLQNRKWGEDYKELRRRLEEAEDKNNLLEEQNKSLGFKLTTFKEGSEKAKAELQKDVSELTDALENYKDKNADHIVRISRLERELHEVFEEKEVACKDLEKANIDVQRLTGELKESDEFVKEQQASFDSQIKILIQKASSAALETQKLMTLVEELTISNEKLERERIETVSGEGLSTLDYTLDNELETSDILSESEPNFSYVTPFHTPRFAEKSLFAEITDSIERNPVSTPLFLFEKPVVCDAYTQITQVKTSYQKYMKILDGIKRTRKFLDLEGKIGDGDHGPNEAYKEQNPASAGDGDNGLLNSGLIEAEGPEDCDEVPEESEVVRRINEELAEFREQLRRSQELFHSLSNSTQNFTITKSCPGLVEVKEEVLLLERPILVTISTQTDSLPELDAQIIQPYRSGVNPDDLVGLFQSLTLGEDDSRYRADALFTVIEESEHEAELSPGSLDRRMSGDKGNRPRLVRMPNTVEDHPLGDEDIKSDQDYMSAASSLSGSKNPSTYNSLERPLQVSHGANGNGDDQSDTCSTISGGNTTYGSPVSSPSSPYWTPSQGSSSQETLTNHDGDKTPIIDDDLLDNEDFDQLGSLSRTGNHSRNSKQRSNSTWDPMLPIDNRHGVMSIGVIPDADQAHMKQYAYDVVARSCDDDAKILSRTEWRTLKSDLERVDLGKYKKAHGQEEDTEEGGFIKPCSSSDLDEEAEKYHETFPNLVEKIFQTLDQIRLEKPEPHPEEIPLLSKRFEELATAFKTDHEKLDFRTDLTKNEYDNARRRMLEISSSLKQTMQKMREEKVSGEIREVFNSIENSTSELELHTESLDRAAMRAGRIDMERRVFKLIEVMVFYVRIIKNIHGTIETENKQAKQLLEDGGIPFPSKKTHGSLHHNNNNNHEKVSSSQEELGEGPTEPMSERAENGNQQHIVQRLLGPKSSMAGPIHNNSTVVLNQKGPPQNFILRWLSEGYGMVRRELYWPWTWDQSWSGIRRGFTLVLMFLGLLLIVQSVIPGSGAKASSVCCYSGDEYTLVGRICSYFGNYGQHRYQVIRY